MKSCRLVRSLLLLALSVAPQRVCAAVGPFSCAALDTVLAASLNIGQVDYGVLARDPGPLTRFLASTREVRPETWSRQERIVFWVNVYNARVLDGVRRRPGLKSVLDVGRTLGVPTLKFFREKRRTAGRSLSLNDIEHGILRKQFPDPRLHFVLNCASASCPVLPARALQASSLDSTLDAATLLFLRDTTKNRVAPDGSLEISSIFKWYRGDFETAAGGLPGFLAQYMQTSERMRPEPKLRFLDYDWSLNGHW